MNSPRVPKTLVAELTYRCNHACVFCSCPWEADSSIKDKELSTNEWKEALLLARQRGLSQVTFSGGEPLMYEGLFELIDYASGLGLTTGLVTNGRLVDDDFLARLRAFDVLLSVSVPGIETFKDTTNVDNIEHVLEIFAKCKDLNIRTCANIAVSKKNLHELYQNIALPVLNGASYVLLNRFLPGGRGLYNQQYLLSVDEINQMLDIAESVLKKAGVFAHVGTEMPLCIIKNPLKYKFISCSSICAAGKAFFVIDPSGYIKVCNHSPIRAAHYKQIDSLDKNGYWNKFVHSDYIPKMCKECPHLNTKCDGGCREAAHVYSDTIDAPDPCFATKPSNLE